MADPHRIDSVETLRELLGTPSQMAQMKVWPTLEPSARDFIARSPFALLATADAKGNTDVSPKGDHPGFVAVEDEHTLFVPDRTGNKLIFGLQNILANPHVSLKPDTVKHVWGEWLPASPYTHVATPDFEWYDERWSPETGAGEIDLYVPIAEARP